MTVEETPVVISVVIATCRRPALAIEAIRSVLLDGFRELEVIVVDQDPSQDLEARIRTSFPAEPRIRYLHLERAALSAARNAGLERARGRIVHFLDDDAELVAGSLRAYAEAFATSPPPGVVAGRLVAAWEAPRPAWFPPSREYLLGVYDRAGALAPMQEPDLPVGANFAVLRSVASEIGPFDERLGFSYARKASMLGGEDSLFSIRARAAGHPILYQPAAVARHRIASAKLRPRAFLRRSYWEGATTATLQHLTGRLGQDDVARVAAGHRRSIRRELRRLVEWRHGRLRLLSRVEWMEALASCAQSAGMLRCCAILKQTGTLP
jgi:GT2 family glycosyltransferase